MAEVTFWGWKVDTFCFSYEAEQDRYSAQVIAEDIDEALRIQSRED